MNDSSSLPASTLPAQSCRPPAVQAVQVRTGTITLPTWMPAPPDKNPMFLERRVYQGSTGRLYPLPLTDRIEEKPVEREWQAIWIENEYLSALVLPELGGRIHALQDRTTGYDLIYRQEAIKPALVGLAGPWISGGIEFNWPQHHRPATFLPVDYEVEEHADGSQTVWCGDHDPMFRLKGMHGVCLHPGKAYLELKVRAYNRTPMVQTFLWWANVATRVHEAYQSFFPPDVYYVADHARRSMSSYPLAENVYYGVDYQRRGIEGVPADQRPTQFVPPHCGGKSPVAYKPNDLSFYANIPTPCSYMCMGSKEDFFGGYDHLAQAGIIHVANHHIAPGKKQWTWGNHEFGYAWDRNLTVPDTNGVYWPYIEIMAGVYTDNQPDFSFLQPGETKTWSQYWYPISKIGPARQANLEAAVSLAFEGRHGRVGVAVTSPHLGAQLTVAARGKRLLFARRDISPASPLIEEFSLPRGVPPEQVEVRVVDGRDHVLIETNNRPCAKGEVPRAAAEPRAPRDMESSDELFLTGLHLEQYRHATSCPTAYWTEALRRDPGDYRCNNAMGLWHLRRGGFSEAREFFRRAIERQTRLNANPHDGEPHYNHGLCLRHMGQADAAYEAFYKATWNQAWAAASYHALAEMDCTRGDWPEALAHLDRSLRLNADNLRARNLKVLALREAGRRTEADALLTTTLALDRLDWWARYLAGQPLLCDLQTALDMALDLQRAGFAKHAITILDGVLALRSAPNNRKANPNGGAQTLSLPDQNLGALPMVYYTLGWLHHQCGQAAAAKANLKRAAAAPPDYCFPARVEEIRILETASRLNPRDARAPYYLGNLFYDKRRHRAAIKLWERSAKMDASFSIVWRNLGIAYYNVLEQPSKARGAYQRACHAAPHDARLLHERDQLLKRLKEPPAKRLALLLQQPEVARKRDDLCVELGSLYLAAGRPEAALELATTRNFQPWEGGEGGPLGLYARAHLALGQRALAANDPAMARNHFEQAMQVPENLGETRHLLANPSETLYWLGCACKALGENAAARSHWRAAATFTGDFQEMSVRTYSELTFFSAMSRIRLGQKAAGEKLFRGLLEHAVAMEKTEAKVDYYATSLPTLLLFNDDLQFRQHVSSCFLQAQAHLGLGDLARAKTLLRRVRHWEPHHFMAAAHLAEL